jgi:ATP-binding cassette subfamily F protein 3
VARRLTHHHGNYTAWAAKRKEQQIMHAREMQNRQNEIDKLKEFAGHGFKYETS